MADAESQEHPVGLVAKIGYWHRALESVALTATHRDGGSRVVIFQRNDPTKWGPTDIRRLRTTLGLSQPQFARAIQCHEQTVIAWERPVEHPRHKFPDDRFSRSLDALEGELHAAQRKAMGAAG